MFSFPRVIVSTIVITAIIGTIASRAIAQSPTEDQLLGMMKSDAPDWKKANAARELKTCGTMRSISVLAALLLDETTSHAARIALESMEYPEAGAALRDAVGKAKGLTQSGIVDSLGERRDPLAIPIIVSLLETKDPRTIAAVATALGKIGTPEAAKALAGELTKASSKNRSFIADGLILCADRLLKAGDPKAAHAIYESVSNPSENRVTRASALRGMFQSTTSEVPNHFVDWLKSDDPMIRAAAAGQLAILSPSDFHAIASHLANLPKDSRIAVLSAMRIRADRSLSPIAVETLRSPDEVVRIAAIRAVGAIGDNQAVGALVQLAAGTDILAETARQCLEDASGQNLDQTMIAVMQAEKDPVARAQRIDLLLSRRVAAAVPALLKEAAGDSAIVRTHAMAALAQLAGSDDIGKLIPAVLKAEPGAERAGAERTVVVVCRQIRDASKRADTVIRRIDGENASDRNALLPLVGRLGGPAAMTMIRAALASSDADTFDAGVLALANWPDASVSDQLIGLATTAKTVDQRCAALHAYIRVAVLPGKVSNAEKLAMLKRAIAMATRDDDRNYAIERAAAVRTVESLRFVMPYLDDPRFAQEACKTVVELAHHKELRNPNLREFEPALERVLKLSADPTTLELARRYLQGN